MYVQHIPRGKEADAMYSTRSGMDCEVRKLRQSFALSEGLPFASMLTPEMLEDIAELREQRVEPTYPSLTTLSLFLSQVLDEDQSCRQAVARLLAELASRQLPACGAGTGGYCKARARLSEAGLRKLTRHTGRQLHQAGEASWQWRGRSVKMGDGSTVLLADTPENQREYPQPDSQKPGLGYPIIRFVVLFCLATGAVLDVALAPYFGKGTGELSLFRQLLENFSSGDVFLADRLFCSYFELALLQARGVDAVVRCHQSRPVDFRQGQRLGHHDHVIVWDKPQRPAWMDQAQYEAMPDTLTVRQVEVPVDKDGFRTERLVIITTLLDAEEITVTDLGELYRCRWQAELSLRSLKCSMQMKDLRSRSPAMARKELWVYLLAYNLLRALIVQAARRVQKKPRQISFKGAVQTLRAFQGYLRRATPESITQLYDALLAAIACHGVDNRPGRHEPRAVKKKHTRYPLLRLTRSQARRIALENRRK
jgi:hypothetical protein